MKSSTMPMLLLTPKDTSQYLIFTDTEGHIIDDDGADVAPPTDHKEDHRNVDPIDGMYMGLYNQQLFCGWCLQC